MKKNFLFLLSAMLLFVFTTKAATFPVTLKVIDLTKGVVTNPSTEADNTDANIYTWIDDALAALNPRTPGDWWYPMYHDAGVISPNGAMNLTADALEWTITLQAEPGEYSWSPGAKSLGWKNINPSMFPFEGDNETNNLYFQVDATGKITGHNELIITEIVEYNEGTMTLTVEVPEGTSAVYVRGLYGSDWDTPIAMEYNAVYGSWIYEIQGNRIPKGQEVQVYKYWWSNDTYATEEAIDDHGTLRETNRTLTYVNGDIVYDEVIAWAGKTGIRQLNPNVGVTIYGKNLSVTGDFSTVKIYQINGRLVDQSQNAGAYSNSRLSTGVYVLQVDGFIQKIIIK
ncbi:MAG: T9SS type A sorting domain-containing protein [Dysgonamonadaceae bacterium]|jgi:hypothetical protein|nr:T9SS type A sorting domain-containing protein [Dysgonamonadaceae bacterium]